ncbi:MAG: hypothetical protein GF355_11550 [Candidatus Eisenbacteria bacterium]|nr:hypothetical protein [Candidatus Eisenbacteria bacterium]
MNLTQLEGLGWRRRWMSQMGCILGCCDYLGLQISSGWLYGGSGQAFVLNIHEEVCPSGPTAWDGRRMLSLAEGLGIRHESVSGSREAGTLAEAREKAWELVRRSIASGIPVYGWELRVPEYYVIHGFDETGYYYSGPGIDGGDGPLPRNELGETGIGMIELHAVHRCPNEDDRSVIRNTLQFALSLNTPSLQRPFPDYALGLDGYDAWIRAMEQGTASQIGIAYNAAVWSECRKEAAAFLNEAGERVPELGGALKETAAFYKAAAESLEEVVSIYPFSPRLGDAPPPADARCERAVVALEQAKRGEVEGLKMSSAILDGYLK